MSFPSSSYAASSSSSSSYRYARLAFLMVERAPVVVATDLPPGDELKKSFGSSMPSSSRRATAFVMPVFLCVKTRGGFPPHPVSLVDLKREDCPSANSPATVVSEHVLVGSLCASCALSSDGRPAVRLSFARALLLLLLVGRGRLV